MPRAATETQTRATLAEPEPMCSRYSVLARPAAPDGQPAELGSVLP